MSKPIPLNDLLKHPMLILATGFGAGLFPKAPGTFGTLAAIPIYLFLSQFSLAVYTIATVVMFLVGITICSKATQILGVHDHGSIVWDEIVGYLITMWLMPTSAMTVLLGFVLFRFFDILKPWPIKALDENVKGGFGIMIDDVLAGVMANLVLLLLIVILF